MTPFLQKKTFGIYRYELLAVLGFYFFFAYLYHLTLWINRLGNNPNISDLFILKQIYNYTGRQYIIKLIFSIPVWWLVFRKFKHRKLKQRLMIHIITFPIWIISVQQVYYLVTEYVGGYHLQSYGQIWDIYIPALFYILQFGLLHTYEYYHTNQQILKQKAALNEAFLKSELSALKAQLNPHFLYNVFNTISASVPAENEKTRELIAKLADLFRYQLKASKKELVPLKEELEFVEKYLDLEKVRFEDRLKVVLDVPQNIREEMVPPMILQPLVENSLKHGLASLIDGGEIFIRIQRKGEKIQFEVSDTGVGVKDKSKIFDVGVGLTNTKLRLEKMYGSEMVISDNYPQGLKIEFSI